MSTRLVTSVLSLVCTRRDTYPRTPKHSGGLSRGFNSPFSAPFGHICSSSSLSLPFSRLLPVLLFYHLYIYISLTHFRSGHRCRSRSDLSFCLVVSFIFLLLSLSFSFYLTHFLRMPRFINNGHVFFQVLRDYTTGPAALANLVGFKFQSYVVCFRFSLRLSVSTHYHTLSPTISHYHTVPHTITQYQALSSFIKHYQERSHTLTYYHIHSRTISHYRTVSHSITKYYTVSSFIKHGHELSRTVSRYHAQPHTSTLPCMLSHTITHTLSQNYHKLS